MKKNLNSLNRNVLSIKHFGQHPVVSYWKLVRFIIHSCPDKKQGNGGIRPFGVSAFIVIMFFFVSGYVSALGQEVDNQSQLQERWSRFLSSEDNEKDFRANSFLRFLEKKLEEGVSGTDSVGLLKKWESDTIAGGRYSVHASYIHFNKMADRVFYCLQHHEKNEVLAFSRELSEKYKDRQAIPRLKRNDEVDEGISLSISSGDQSLLSVPDIQALVLVKKLSRTRGGQDSFDISGSLSSRIRKLMEVPSLFENDFSGFPGISTLLSSDKRLKIVTWNVEDMNGTHHFYGIVTIKREGSLEVIELKDRRDAIESPENVGLDASKWYGAIYYKIIPVEYQGETCYTMLGYNGKDSFSQERIVDFIRISSGGEVSFGAPVFVYQGRRMHRLIFEYSNQANMMLRYDRENERIVMDHLAPRSPRYEGDRSYYGPDFSYDALKFDGAKWRLIEDVEVRNR